MLAARLYNKDDIRLDEVATPTIKADEILLQVRSSAICGTDMRMYKNGHTCASPDHPLTLGHEMSGVIAEVGAEVQGYEVGATVSVAPNMGCGICDHCVAGSTHMCPDYQALGIQIDGSFAEFVRIPAAAIRQGNVCPLPAGMSFETAALCEPLSCVYNAFERAAPEPGATVLIIGAGPIGLMHAMCHKMAGAKRVIINDLSEERLAQFTAIDPFFETLHCDDVKTAIMDMTGGRGVDVCITACPAPAVQALAVEIAAVNGSVIFFGGLPPHAEMVPINTNLIHYRQIKVSGTTRSSLRQFRTCIALVASGRLDVDRCITSRTPLADIHSALAQAGAGSQLKSMVTF